MSAQPNARRVRVVLLGCGAINSRVLVLLRSRHSPVEIAGVIRRTQGGSLPAAKGIPAILSRGDLEAARPDVILEAATREAVRQWGAIGLQVARRVIISSSSAFTDDQLLQELRRTAASHASQLVLSPGALAGVEALSAAARLSIREVHHRIIKPPASWGIPAGAQESRAPGATVLFKGSARECARRYPLNANVTVVSALSGVGLDATVVELICDPEARANRHEIHASGDFGVLTVSVENRPLQANPRSSELAALALVRLAENEAAELVL